MPKLDVITTSGEKKGTVSFDFDKKVSSILVSNVVLTNLSNKRRVIANTKDRSEVRGGGRKPWRQKGTGRARHGSRRSPIWVGGGITFGPTNYRNFFKRINKKQKSLAIASIFLEKIKEKHFKIIEKIAIESNKSKNFIRFISSLGIDGSVIIILDKEISDSLEGEKIYSASRNIPFLKVVNVEKINSFMVLKYEWVIITKKAFGQLKKRVEFISKKENKNIKEEKQNKKS